MIGTLALLLVAQAVDPGVLKLLADADARQQQVKSITATCEYTVERLASASRPASAFRIISDARLMRPNLVYVKSTISQSANGAWSSEKPFETIACDGKTSWLTEDQENRIAASKAEPTGQNVNLILQGPLASFFRPDQAWHKTVGQLQEEGKLRSLSFAPTVSSEGQSFRVVRLCYQEAQSTILDTMDLMINKDGLVSSTRVSKSDSSKIISYQLENIHINDPLPKSAFAFYPPSNYTEGTDVELKRPPDGRIGKPAPLFTVQTLDGKTVSLSDFKGQTVILDFWATWCGNCTAKMPNLNQLAEKYKSQHVVVLAVNAGDPEKKYHDWLRRHPYKDLQFAFDPEGSFGKGSYGAYRAGLPSTFVIDRDGNLADVDPEDLQKSIERVTEVKQ